jgi:hypothetical protein
MTRPEAIRCFDYSVRLAEALDGLANAETLETLRAHAATCADCRGLHDLAREGKNWLGTLDDVEPPAQLVHDILAQTQSVAALATRPPRSAAPWWEALVAGMRHPRLVMTAAMAFFSMSLVSNMTGVSFDDLRALRPSRLGSRLSLEYQATTARVVRYYENNRLVHEIETRLRDLQDDATLDPERDPEPHSPTDGPAGRIDEDPSGPAGERQVNG